jgi:pyruvate ferredoxin oxidoreductase gamma subunit
MTRVRAAQIGRAPSVAESTMYEIRIHGRGGQGAVTAAELLSVAAFDAGSTSQAFPSFGSERAGAPVAAFCRIDDRVIRLREPVVTPDAVIILDSTLLHAVDVFQGLKPGAVVLINSAHPVADLGLSELAENEGASVVCVPATEIGLRHLGRPLPNGVMLGGFAALTGVVPIAAIEQALRERFAGPIGEKNAAAAHEAFDAVQADVQEAAGV